MTPRAPKSSESCAHLVEKELALRAMLHIPNGAARVTLWIGTALRRHLERAGWRFQVLSAGPDPDADDGSLAYVMRVRHVPPGGAA